MPKIDKKTLKEMIYSDKSQLSIVNMTYKNDPPPFISIMGPRESGKTTLLKSIFYYYWKKDILTDGITTTKISHKRFTFYEAMNEINNNIDTIKISDMIIILINAKIGIEKELLETINIINSQGVPKLCFVITNAESDKKAVKEITRRIQKEFSYPMKFFNFDKLKDEKNYKKIGALVRLIDTMKYRPIEWKCVHPHIVVDKISNNYAYGYVRGGPLHSNFESHIPGFGDFCVNNLEITQDPCSLKSRFNILYNSKHLESIELENHSGNADKFEIEDQEINLFESTDEEKLHLQPDKKLTAQDSKVKSETENSEIVEDQLSVDTDIVEPESTENENSLDSFELAKDGIRGKFKDVNSSDADYEKKFDEEYNENTKIKDFLVDEKRFNLENKVKYESVSSAILPGNYVRFKIKPAINLDLIIVGSYLPTEQAIITLQGQITKNKWQKFDLKSNSPFYVSMGWFRFQTIPIFTRGEKMIKYCKTNSELLFTAPNVPNGTSFLFYSMDSDYKILATGKILDASGDIKVKKKLKLIGHPKNIIGNNVIVGSMFSSNYEVDKFRGAKLATASGLRGLIKTPIGVDGSFRATFEGSLLMSETIFLKCLVPVELFQYLKHIKPNEKYLRPLKKIRNDNDLEDSESCYSKSEEEYDSDSKDSINEEVPIEDKGYLKKKRQLDELKNLEKNLPFSKRTVTEVKFELDLPIPPEAREEFMKNRKIEEQRKIEDEKFLQLKLKKKDEKYKRKIQESKLEQERKNKNAVAGFLQKRSHKRHKR